jgi:hypothetical protein
MAEMELLLGMTEENVHELYIVASLRVELDRRKRASLKIMGHFQVVRIEIQSDGQQAAEYILIRKKYIVCLSLCMYLHYDKI